MLIVTADVFSIELISHRGNCCGHLENTLPAIAGAWEAQADAVEIDIRLSKDKELLLYHDESMSGRAISSMLFSEILELNREIPRLSSVLDAGVPRGYLIFDLKEQSQDYLNELIKALKASNIHLNRFAFQSPELESLLFLKQALPESHYIFLSKKRVVPYFSISNAKKLAKLLSKNNIGAVSIKGRRYINKKYVDAFKASGISVNVWTINEIDRAEHYASMGVSGLITDNLLVLSEVVR